MAETVPEQNDRPPENMQLTIDALNAHPDIVVVGGYERTFLDPNRCPPVIEGRIAHNLEIFTHPVTALHEPQALNELAAAVIGDLPTVRRDHAKQVYPDNPASLKPPMWLIDDTIGAITLQGAISPHADSTAVKVGMIPPTIPLNYSFNLLQRTAVTIFPDIHHVAAAAREEVEYREPVLNVPLQESEEGHFIRLLAHAPALGGSRSFEVEGLLLTRGAFRGIPGRLIDNGA